MKTASAPGKLMLMGEHAVVYGYPSIVMAVDHRLYVSVDEQDAKADTIISPQSNDTRFVRAAIRVARRTFDHVPNSLLIRTHGSFSGKYGFGSSSAVTVATLKAIASYIGARVSKEMLFDLAYDAVLSVQTVGSGFDVSAAVHGGTRRYTKGSGNTTNLNGAAKKMCIVVGYTGVKAKTVPLVQKVARAYKEHTRKVSKMFADIAILVNDAETAIKRRQWKTLGKLLDENHMILKQLGVSSPELEALIRASKRAGAVGAKLSGAGGGDCMIALVYKKDKVKVERAIARAGGEVVDVELNARGVRLEKGGA